MKHILAIGFNSTMFTSVENTLKPYYDVLSLPSNRELITFFRQRKPVDLFLLTISEDDIEGLDAYDLIKRFPAMKTKPIIFLSESKDTMLEKKVFLLGETDYISLPVTEEMLLHRVDNGIELADLRRERPYVERYQDAISISFAELVECRDGTTGGHLKNTTRYFDILLHAAMESDDYIDEISPEEVAVLLRSAALHDIGKIGINDEILRKGSSLEDYEFEYMKTHTTLGKLAFEKIIKETGGTRWLYIAMDMAYCHHEHWDGSGYPNGLKGENIPLYARMLSIADVYDALTSSRAYKEAYSHQKAMNLIVEGKGSLFDPTLVNIFIMVNEEFEKQLYENKKVTIH
jgi:putative two-component system response regulator